MRQRSLPLRPLHKHRDRRSNALIDEHHEYLVLVAKEDCVAAAGRSHRTDLNFDNGFTHTSSSTARLPSFATSALKGSGCFAFGLFAMSTLFEFVNMEVIRNRFWPSGRWPGV